jgi:hypothetical protein
VRLVGRHDVTGGWSSASDAIFCASTTARPNSSRIVGFGDAKGASRVGVQLEIVMAAKRAASAAPALRTI